MSLNKEETVKLYKSLNAIIQESKVYDEGLITTIYTLIFKNLFEKLLNSRIKCYSTKTRHLICEASFDSTKTYETTLKIQIGDKTSKFKTTRDAVRIVQQIITDDLGIPPKHSYAIQKQNLNTLIDDNLGIPPRYSYAVQEKGTDTIYFLVTPILDRYKDGDVVNVFKELRLFLHDQKNNGYFMLIFKKLLKDIFSEFKNYVDIRSDINMVYCYFNNELEMKMAEDVLTSFFGFQKNDGMFFTSPNNNKIVIEPIDTRIYDLDKNQGSKGGKSK